jgi:hypothetical protein
MVSSLGFKKMATGIRFRDLWKDLHLKEDQVDQVDQEDQEDQEDHVVEMDKWRAMDLLLKDHQPTPPPAIE